MLKLVLAVAAITISIDQATKAVVVDTMGQGESVAVIEGVLHWTFHRNPGAAFGLFTSLPVLFTILATLISIAIVSYAPRVRDGLTGVALGLILGGALGNLIDRVARAPGVFRGHVIDFIDLRVWPVFNVADSAVVVGAGLLVVSSWLLERRARERAG